MLYLILNSVHVIGESWLPLANFIGLIATLAVLGVYTLFTRRIQSAAQEQAEAPQKPVIVLLTMQRSAQDQILDHTAGEMGAAALRVNQHDGYLVIRNIGDGIAIDVRYEFKFGNEQKPRARRLPYLRGDDSLQAPIAAATAQTQTLEFVATFKSLSGKRYKTKITVRNLAVESCTFEPMRQLWFRHS
jgi:hypothetical protein